MVVLRHTEDVEHLVVVEHQHLGERRADALGAGREFGLLIRGSDDIASWLCAASAFFALGHTFRHGELVRVGLFIDRLEGGVRARRA